MFFRSLIVLLAVTGCTSVVDYQDPLTITVMTFNTWGAGSNAGKSVDETVAVIRQLNPDIIGLQETRPLSSACASDDEDCPASGPSLAAEIAQSLDYYYYNQQQNNSALWANAVLSRYPIQRSTPNDLGVVIEVQGYKVAMFNLHLASSPYQPYQLMGIPYDNTPFLNSAAEAIASASQARGPALKLLMTDLETVSDADVALVVGDFNEPSHRDWTKRAAQLGRHPLPVKYPSALQVEQAGFKDAYRTVYPDEIARPGFTWTPTTLPDDTGDHHDRIDYVFVRAAEGQIKSAHVAGEKSAASDIGFDHWPSDHRAVVATYSFPK